jgi:hypothetical protein
VAARPRPILAPRHRLPVLGIVGLLAVLGLISVLRSATAADRVPERDGAAADEAPGPSRGAAPEGAADEGADEGAAPTRAFASIDGVTLHLPAAEVVLVGFHEASSSEALAFVPHGRLEDHQNTTKFDAPADAEVGPAYVVLASRGRPHPATSAIDVLLDEAEPVRSPVTGTVTDVRGYHLYGRYADLRIEIAPDEAPEQRIVMIHLEDAAVSVGESVVVGETIVAAGARVLPFGSNIDRYTEPDRYPHVHYEIKRWVPAPVDAEDADAAAAVEEAGDGG